MPRGSSPPTRGHTPPRLGHPSFNGVPPVDRIRGRVSRVGEGIVAVGTGGEGPLLPKEVGEPGRPEPDILEGSFRKGSILWNSLRAEPWINFEKGVRNVRDWCRSRIQVLSGAGVERSRAERPGRCKILHLPMKRTSMFGRFGHCI
jgi:hypothetical protein